MIVRNHQIKNKKLRKKNLLYIFGIRPITKRQDGCDSVHGFQEITIMVLILKLLKICLL